MDESLKARGILEERFWAKVQRRSSGCWLWTASTTNKGYGQFAIDGTMRGAHRVAWTFERGLIPEGLCVLHRCDQPLCVRPEHLFLGTLAENSQDMASKGRMAQQRDARIQTRGEATKIAKLTAEKVRMIRDLVDAGWGRADIAEAFEINVSHVYRVGKRTTWAHVV